ncbi:AcrR family transcriptional regulator [Microbacterium endophyticum]|uniref:AcrR family transcriptional regulator n=1 Tax=Microbacterium endophyticum TaxID=1526412 RepID=A0A7W4V4E7_9MICO|nr:TetR/AcrR family transcriptional regulator [Microbacterium endophyticum]MBB2976620.1 AcrR family transcriptional regulator [Microbacterium endophyticum]NIK37497.1 AcrR family transcriptional regulator [Microbacterium endophyticum]
MPKAVPQSSYAPGRVRREQIISAAFTAFGAVGYRQTSMSKIAEDCGVSRAGLLHHFPTKEALLQAVLDERDRLAYEKIFADAPGPQADGLDHFERLVRLSAYNASTPGLVSLYAVLSAEATDHAHPAHPYFSRRYDGSRLDLGAAVDNLRSRGLLRSPDIRSTDTAIDVIALMDGLQIQWLISPGVVDMPARLRERLESVLAEPLAPGEDPR